MRKLTSDNRSLISAAILAASVPVYARLCWPAIIRRGFPEIDPFWLAMSWLWIFPITLSGLFDQATQSRKWRVAFYTLLCAFFFSGTVVTIVPHHVTFGDMLSGLLFWGPVNLLIAFVVEKLSQRLFRRLRFSENSSPDDLSKTIYFRKVFALVVILGLAVAFPFVWRAMIFRGARADGRADAERDWAQGSAIWYMRRSDPPIFGASGADDYSVANGLRTEEMKPGVTSTVYCEAYRAVVEGKLAQFGPTDKIRDLFTEAELQSLIKEGRFKRVETFPLKQGTTEISPSGYKTSSGPACYSGEPSKFVYCAIVPEKKNALVIINDDSIWIFAESGQLLQSIDDDSYRQMGITEDAMLVHH